VSRPLGKSTFGQSLNPPGDPAKQELLMVRPRLFAKDLVVLFPKLAHRHEPQFFNLLSNFHLHLLPSRRR